MEKYCILRFFITSKIQQLQNGTPQWSCCWRGRGNSLADHHVVIRPYLLRVAVEIKLMTGLEINHDFSTKYLGKIPLKLNSPDTYFCQILLGASKKAIAEKE